MGRLGKLVMVARIAAAVQLATLSALTTCAYIQLDAARGANIAWLTNVGLFFALLSPAMTARVARLFESLSCHRLFDLCRRSEAESVAARRQHAFEMLYNDYTLQLVFTSAVPLMPACMLVLAFALEKHAAGLVGVILLGAFLLNQFPTARRVREWLRRMLRSGRGVPPS